MAIQEQVGDVSVGWIYRLNDSVLTALIHEAQQNNKDLQVAAAEVEKSWTLVRQADAKLSPTVSGTVGAGSSGTAENSNRNSNYEVGLQASWELDVWGRLAAGSDAELLSAQSVKADYIHSLHRAEQCGGERHF